MGENGAPIDSAGTAAYEKPHAYTYIERSPICCVELMAAQEDAIFEFQLYGARKEKHILERIWWNTTIRRKFSHFKEKRDDEKKKQKEKSYSHAKFDTQLFFTDRYRYTVICAYTLWTRFFFPANKFFS